MQEKQTPLSGNEDRSILPRTQNLLRHLESLWETSQGQNAEMLKRVTRFITDLPEPYKVMALTKIAESQASNLALHFLDIMATFREKAEDEGISLEEYGKTLQGVLPELFPDIMSLPKHLSVRSLDDLVTLSNITISLYVLSEVETAEEAQSWMYELPILYWRQLRQEHLVMPVQAQVIITKSTETTRIRGYTTWDSALPDPVQVSSGKSLSRKSKNMPKLA